MRKTTLRWMVGIVGALVFVTLTWLLLPHQRRLKIPGPEVKVCLALSRLAGSVGSKVIQDKLVRMANTIHERRIDNALKRGRLVVIRIDAPDLDPGELGLRAAKYVTSNQIFVLRSTVTFQPNMAEFVVDSEDKALMEAFRNVLKVQPHRAAQ